MIKTLTHLLILNNIGSLTGLIKRLDGKDELMLSRLGKHQLRGEGKEPVWKDGREGDVNEEKEGEEQIGLNYTFYLTPQLPSDTTLLVFVKSKMENLHERQLIRETWGGVPKLEGKTLKVIFIIEENMNRKTPVNTISVENWEHFNIKSRSLYSKDTFFSNSNSKKKGTSSVLRLSKLVELENMKFHDILLGTPQWMGPEPLVGVESLVGMRWLVDQGPGILEQIRFVVFTTDDVFIEIYHLFYFLTAVYWNSPPFLACDFRTSGTSNVYIEYCSTAGYIISPSLLKSFLKESEASILKRGQTEENVRIGPDINTLDGGVLHELPVEETHELYSYPKSGKSIDEWLTGDVRVILGVSPLYLNLRYCYEELSVDRWLSSHLSNPLPFIFLQIHTSDWSKLYRTVWKKSGKVQHS
ncbi:uncharacterized protein LOC111708413 [Eurytemora carolleeae]|uniref:uncharacterized protein LOC111708413 n=1 Tax=Eurytemora carolleeae TaxID=1294199 RepID=UPI000C792402|nr:uncharacterized protein LOC111708413 [Eurytemora carolleeae]|eukprot:XP_023337540.1 uncharacterized protein LOC111708413 [Eurytemora affinis]